MILLQQRQFALRTSSTVCGGIPQVSTTFSLECGEWAPDSARVWRWWAGWRGTGLPEPSRETKFSGANVDKEKFIFPVQLNTCRMGNLTRLIYTLAIYVVRWRLNNRFIHVGVDTSRYAPPIGGRSSYPPLVKLLCLRSVWVVVYHVCSLE